jgi:hypothetical protein
MFVISKTTLPRVGRGSPLGASVDLDFTRQRAFVSGVEQPLQALLTTTRSTIARYVGPDGTIQQAAANTPRFGWRVGALEPRGLIVEGPSSNLCAYSNDFTSGWVLGNGATASYGGAIAPDGTGLASLLTDSSSGSAGNWGYTTTVPNDSNPQVWSVYLKTGSIGKFTLAIALTGGTGVSGGLSVDLTLGRVFNITGTPITADVEPAGYGYSRVQIALQNNSSGNTSCVFVMAREATISPGGYFYAWGAQQEALARASSVILTSGSAATRSADLIYATLGAWFNASYGTWFIDCEFDAAGIDQIPFAVFDGTFNNGFYTIFAHSAPAYEVVLKKSGQADQALPASGAASPGFARAAFSLQPNAIAMAAMTPSYAFVNGQSAPLSLTGTFSMPTGLNTLQLGDFATAAPTYGCIKRLAYWPDVLSAQSLSDLVA